MKKKILITFVLVIVLILLIDAGRAILSGEPLHIWSDKMVYDTDLPYCQGSDPGFDSRCTIVHQKCRLFICTKIQNDLLVFLRN